MLASAARFMELDKPNNLDATGPVLDLLHQGGSRPDLEPKLRKAIVDRDTAMHNLEEIIPCER
jgi:hypothetical protein